MAYAGQTIENPVSGERITFIQTSADTDGELLEIELALSPDGAVPGAHIHPEQEERFEIVEGTISFRMGLKKVVAGPGDVVTVPAGKVHAFKNAGEDTAKVRVQVRPALAMEQLFETTVALAEDGRTTAKGMPRPLDLALFVRRYRREVKAPFPPAPVVRAMLARSRGWRRARATASATRRSPPSSRQRSDLRPARFAWAGWTAPAQARERMMAVKRRKPPRRQLLSPPIGTRPARL
jgi:quercetin dioxygenase-like cupin family protein